MKIGYPLALQTYYLGRINRFFVRLSLIFFAKKKNRKKKATGCKEFTVQGYIAQHQVTAWPPPQKKIFFFSASVQRWYKLGGWSAINFEPQKLPSCMKILQF